jgi:hypothetical protein
MTVDDILQRMQSMRPDHQTTKPCPPPMVVVHQGWFRWAGREVRQSVLARYDLMRGRLRGRPWWRGLNQRWEQL